MTAHFRSLDEYLRELSDQVLQRSWDYAVYAAQLLSVRENHSECECLWLNSPDQSVIRKRVSQPFDGIVCHHLRVLHLLSQGLYSEAYKQQADLAQVFIKDVLKNDRLQGNWYLPICFRICGDLRLIAKTADMQDTTSSAANAMQLEHDDSTHEVSSLYEKSASVIMDCYRACVGDTRTSMDSSKRLGLLNLTNQLFRIYFRINKLNLLKPLIRAIDNCGDLYDHFCMADKVTYSYYIGRKAMVDSRLDFAENELDFAYRNTPDDSHRNKRLILMYLIPVKMQLGHMPNEQLLKQYGLHEFAEVLPAVKSGNVRELEKVLEKHRLFFIQAGIFLMMEKLTITTYRTLFKKVCAILKTNQISLNLFLQALKFLGIDDVDQDEVACIIANLIHEGKMKGYLSYQHQKLVISKLEPFPKLSSVTPA